MTGGELRKEIDDLLKHQLAAYFTSEVRVCELCHHHESSHYWNGGGNPEASGYDACKSEGCDCKGNFTSIGYLVTDVEHLVDDEAIDECLKVIEARIKELEGKDNGDSNI